MRNLIEGGNKAETIRFHIDRPNARVKSQGKTKLDGCSFSKLDGGSKTQLFSTRKDNLTLSISDKGPKASNTQRACDRNLCVLLRKICISTNLDSKYIDYEMMY
ncbi:hypothetical protein ACOSQ3_030371 [Xanthoceras sorbifolium]